MSRFLCQNMASLTPYTPGEQPRDQKYVKLNTNESPFPPSAKALAAAAEAMAAAHLYPDPEATELKHRMAERYGLAPEQILPTNGSDEILNFAFAAFCGQGAVFPDITYGFYPVFAKLNRIPYEEIPLKDDFTVDPSDYRGRKETVFLANPNAPTGIALPAAAVEELLRQDPDRLVVVDEAYVDFGAESCIGLIETYDNLLVTQTFSKSRSLAGARLGFGMGQADLIRDLKTIQYSTNPYNVSRAAMAAGIGALEDEQYTRQNCRTIEENRAFTAEKLAELGFSMTPSAANFLFVTHPRLDGGALYRELKQRGILIRHFDKSRIREYNRITVGTRAQMETLLRAVKTILEETL